MPWNPPRSLIRSAEAGAAIRSDARRVVRRPAKVRNTVFSPLPFVLSSDRVGAQRRIEGAYRSMSSSRQPVLRYEPSIRAFGTTRSLLRTNGLAPTRVPSPFAAFGVSPSPLQGRGKGPGRRLPGGKGEGTPDHQNGLTTEKKRPSHPWRPARATSPLPVYEICASATRVDRMRLFASMSAVRTSPLIFRNSSPRFSVHALLALHQHRAVGIDLARPSR